MGDDARAVLEMIKHQYGFGKTENGLGQAQFVAFGNGQALKTRRHFVGQVADRAAVKTRQSVVRRPGWCDQAILPQLGLDEIERVVTVNLLKRIRALDTLLFA